MYAVVKIGSEQFKVAEGDVIEANRLSDEDGKEIALDVLAYENGADVRIGTPVLKDVKVLATVKAKTQGERVIAFKARTHSQRIRGHRAQLTALSITKIQVN
ncbi:MAG: 50S ribosomal protein L21 [Candidatus Omnitrophica bacterium]|nr:50S ribosomal protein L21 [Candidatus Omnitrophota bacterium]